jgi:peptidoglycan/LPS O-acetylase OafA/YrhL
MGDRWFILLAFFILPGFVLMHSYWHRIQSGVQGFGQFVKLAPIRLAPLLYFDSLLGTHNTGCIG